MDEVQNVEKGGENWMSSAVGRHSKGITLWVKTIQPVEEFIANLALPRDENQYDVGVPQPAPRGRAVVMGGGRPQAQPIRDELAWAQNLNAPLNVRDDAAVGVNANVPLLDDLSKFGRKWIPAGDEPLSVYRIQHEIETPYNYTLNSVGGGLLTGNANINLSFLRIKGISSPQGIKIVIVGPMGTSDARTMIARVGATARQFFTEYIAPFGVNLRITSTGV